MSTDRLQLTLLPYPKDQVQFVPPDAREESIGVIARMLLVLVRGELGEACGAEEEKCHEPR